MSDHSDIASSERTCPICGSPLAIAFHYDEPPPGETRFELPPGETYERDLLSCHDCGHFVSVGGPDLNGIYDRDYVDTTYGDGGMRAAFDRIMSLPPERSDNTQRVERILDYVASTRAEEAGSVLDVGSGLAVFPARMREAGWLVTALDPDPRAAQHARDAAGVDAVCASFVEADGLGRFGLVSFNKVLEHIDDPVEMLARARRFLADGGLVYVEVPDGTLAARDPAGPAREEFAIEHLHCFSAASLALMIRRAGFVLRRLDRVRDPSDKYTLAAFAEPLPLDVDEVPLGVFARPALHDA